MTATAGATTTGYFSNLPAWFAAVALIVIAALAGPHIGTSARYLFLAGAVGVGLYAWRQSPASHLQAALVLFALTPFVRRVIDLAIGYDHAAMMIAGPLLMLLAPLPDIARTISHARILDRRLLPHAVLGGCIAYAVVLTIVNGDWSQALSSGLKWSAPLIYGVVLYAERVDTRAMLDAMASTLLWILPVIGVYGIYQFIDPPLWDRLWLAMAAMTSAGTPEPYEVRTFSTMHAPAGFATFTAMGLLIIAFLRSGIVTHILLVPPAIALLLSLYRTAWLTLIACLLFCVFFAATRSKAAFVFATAAVVVAGAMTLLPYSDVITGRLATLLDPSNDPSGQERLGQFFALYGRTDSSLWGNGFSAVDVGVAGAEAVDGMVIACWTSMGIVVGLIFLATLLVMIALAIERASSLATLHSVIAGAAVAGFLVQIPLATLVSGELGFLFYTFVTLALFSRPERRS